MRVKVGAAPERKADQREMAAQSQREGTHMNLELPTTKSFSEPEEPRAMLTKRELRELSQISTTRSALHIIIEWMLILAAIRVCERFWEPWLYLATIVVIATRQHSLMIMLHEGTHYRLCRNRKINDWVSELVLAWPVLISGRSYRANHFAHHRYLNTDRDPDWVRRRGDQNWVFPKRPREMAGLLLGDLTGLGAVALVKLLRTVASRDTEVPMGFLMARYLYYAGVMTIAFWTGTARLLLLYWFVPLFTCLVCIFRIRSIAEHSALGAERTPYAGTRTTLPSLLERIFLAPNNVNYHLEHHMYPSVPFFRLPKLHALLRAKPEFGQAHITHGYIGVLRECVADADSLVNGETRPKPRDLVLQASTVAGPG
jgi:fatty acid desaturase